MSVKHKQFIRRRFGVGQGVSSVPPTSSLLSEQLFTLQTTVEMLENQIALQKEALDQNLEAMNAMSSLFQQRQLIIEKQDLEIAQHLETIDVLERTIDEQMKFTWAFKRCLKIIFSFWK